jgi:hypothetical protein
MEDNEKTHPLNCNSCKTKHCPVMVSAGRKPIDGDYHEIHEAIMRCGCASHSNNGKDIDDVIKWLNKYFDYYNSKDKTPIPSGLLSGCGIRYDVINKVKSLQGEKK